MWNRPLSNGALAGALGRPDLSYTAARGVVGSPPLVVVGGTADASTGLTGSGQYAVAGLMILVLSYAGFTWWVRSHLA
jgi:hypothetical protein